MAHWDSTQGQANMAKIMQKYPYLWHFPPEKLKDKVKNFFSIIGLQSSAGKVAHAGLKGSIQNSYFWGLLWKNMYLVLERFRKLNSVW